MSELDMKVYYGAAIGAIELIAIALIVYAIFAQKPRLGIAAALVLIVCVNLPFPQLEFRP